MDDGPIPRVGVGMVIGLLEILDDLGGRADIFKLAAELAMELDDIGPVIETAQLLGFVETKQGDIRLVQSGKELLEADINARKAMVGEKLKQLKIFNDILKLPESRQGKPLRRRQIINLLIRTMSDDEAENIFQTLVDWGRFAEIIDYDYNREILSIV